MADCYKTCSRAEQANYVAIAVLSQLGLDEPSQQQINIMEPIISFAIDPRYVTFKALKACIGDDTLAHKILLNYMRNMRSVVR